ncbi:MAG: DUF4860 domain-containing protein [Oscillospiraceae bacterium]|nr:DUF4860 domain-containing protein [Oscillospiraceae bacterium]
MNRVGKHRIDTIFVLIIFCIFAVSVLMVLMLGASIYQNMTEISRENQEERTVLSYIRTKIRNNDENWRIYIGEFAGLPALVYDEEFDGRQFRTVIYHYNGWLYELFTEVGLELFPTDGKQIMELGGISFEECGYGMIRVTSGPKSLMIYQRTSAQDAPDSMGEAVTLE